MKVPLSPVPVEVDVLEVSIWFELKPEAVASKGDRFIGPWNLNLGGAAKLSHQGLVNAGLDEMTSLEDLGINSMRATDASLELAGRLPRLKTLWLDGLPISDDGLAHLSGCRELTLLSLPGTPVSDAGLVHLKGLSNLKRVRLMEAGKVTDKGVADLQAALPDCNVDR